MNIQINNLTKKYGKKTVFDGFSAKLSFDKILVIKGPSGSGKTTLIKSLAALEKYDGEIKMPTDKISFMFQEDRLIPFISVLKNVAAVSDTETAKRYLTALGLENELGSPPAALSGGMKRRVALARALSHPAELLILDEPFKGMDEALKKDVINIILKESESRAFIIVTHDSEDEKLLNAKVFNL